MQPAEFNFPPCIAGDTFGLVKITDAGALEYQPYSFKMPFSLTGCEIRMWWATSRVGADPVKEFSTDNGTLMIGGEDTVVIPTFNMDLPPFKFSYDLNIKTPESEEYNITPMRGYVIVTPEITKQNG